MLGIGSMWYIQVRGARYRVYVIILSADHQNNRELFDNQLMSIPSELNKLTKLKSFNIYHNQLRGVPFPLSYAPVDSCQAQGVYQATYEETNCFTTCPPKCATSNRRWPNCASTSTTPNSTPNPPIPLEVAQHSALMAVYDNCVPPLDTSKFPRFGVNELCQGDDVICNDGKVTFL